MTTLNQAGEAIVERFVTGLPSTAATFNNEEYDPPTVDTTWVRLIYKLATGGQETLGKETNRKYERVGMIFAQVFTPINQGSSGAEILAETIQTLYESKKFNGVTCGDAVIRDNGKQDGWYQVSVDINFKFYEIK
ncbi:MAG: DUF4128 domain-containing protein [Gammaproteobacteria bacterium]|nr:DUF4128 domain-containing protein [Gammaproteobacteria bacterium]